ncbi:MAG: DUF2007 domain-containing protein [Nocardioides sp.]
MLDTVELTRTNDPVLLSFLQALLADAGIDWFVADASMAVIEGTIAVWQRRLLVPAELEDEARQLLRDADLP